MDNVSDEILMAYADGELGRDERAAVAVAITADPALQSRLDVFVEGSFFLETAADELLKLPVSEELMALVAGPARPADTQVGAPAARTGAIEKRSSIADFFQNFLPAGGSLSSAAMAFGMTLVLGGAVAWQLKSPSHDGGSLSTALIAMEQGRLVASDKLTVAFNTVPTGSVMKLSSETGEAVTIRPVATFLSVSSQYCRQYEMVVPASGAASTGTKGFAGVACRSKDGHWTIPVHVAATPRLQDDSAIRPSSGENNSTVDKVVDQLIDGDVLDVADEQKLINEGWKTTR